MNEMIKMIIVLTVLSSSSGSLLSYLKDKTKDQIENQQLQFVKGPAIKTILEGASNDLVTDRFKLSIGDTEKSFFVGRFNGSSNTLAFESFANGYGGRIGLMVGVNLEEDKVVGVAVTTHSETPGLGAKAKDDPAFVSQFKGFSINDPFNVTDDGGKINAMSGATITSKAVCSAATSAGKMYRELKPQLTEKLKDFSK